MSMQGFQSFFHLFQHFVTAQLAISSIKGLKVDAEQNCYCNSSERLDQCVPRLHKHGLTILNRTHYVEFILKSIWRGIVKPNRNNNFQSNISKNIAFKSRYFYMCQTVQTLDVNGLINIFSQSLSSIWEYDHPPQAIFLHEPLSWCPLEYTLLGYHNWPQTTLRVFRYQMDTHNSTGRSQMVFGFL